VTRAHAPPTGGGGGAGGGAVKLTCGAIDIGAKGSILVRGGAGGRSHQAGTQPFTGIGGIARGGGYDGGAIR
jgi:hypothetical protein